MEDLNLTETEMRYFGDLFLCCDEESNGKIPILKATELFRSSNIPNDVLKQIMDISVAPNNCAALNHMNRKQFYSSLKLIAAHQQNLALKPELLSSALELPLPRFTWALNSEANADLIQLSNSPKEQHIPKRDRPFPSGVGAYEPIRLSSNLSDSDVPQTLSHDNAEALSTDSEVESETTSQRSDSRGRRHKNGSPWSTGSESPTPTNSVAERHPVWEHSATGRGLWPSNTHEEHAQLLGTEEESSDRHSSEEEGSGSTCSAGGTGVAAAPWGMTGAQARHYAAQFQQLRPERGLLSGHTARLFFEKSRLPVPDLRKIWQLSDINKDGALSLEEFCIAMHLIVLRRSDVPVPDALPPALAPPALAPPALAPALAPAQPDLLDLAPDMIGSGTSADFNFPPKSEPDPYDLPKPPKKHTEETRTSLTPTKPDSQPGANKEWTKFVDSPTSSLSSPGPKPVNFDFHKSAVERDPKIFHPVALRVTPDGAPIEERERGREDAFELSSPRRTASQPPVEDIKSIQRPQGKKPGRGAGALPPPPAREPSVHEEGPASLQFAPRKEPPPPPPPRPLRNHARSSSLDLNKYKNKPCVSAAPAPPPRASPPHAFPPQRDDSPRMHGAFEVYRNRGKPGASPAPPGPPGPADLRALHEQNAVLLRVCRALQLELADVARDREALQAKLDAPVTAPAPLAPLAPSSTAV